MEVGNESKIVRYFIRDHYLSTLLHCGIPRFDLLLLKAFPFFPGFLNPPNVPSAPYRAARSSALSPFHPACFYRSSGSGGLAVRAYAGGSPARFHVEIRRENSSLRTPKTHFFSFSTCFSPSGKRSAIQKRLLTYISEPALRRIKPNGAHSEIS